MGNQQCQTFDQKKEMKHSIKTKGQKHKKHKLQDEGFNSGNVSDENIEDSDEPLHNLDEKMKVQYTKQNYSNKISTILHRIDNNPYTMLIKDLFKIQQNLNIRLTDIVELTCFLVVNSTPDEIKNVERMCQNSLLNSVKDILLNYQNDIQKLKVEKVDIISQKGRIFVKGKPSLIILFLFKFQSVTSYRRDLKTKFIITHLQQINRGYFWPKNKVQKYEFFNIIKQKSNSVQVQAGQKRLLFERGQQNHRKSCNFYSSFFQFFKTQLNNRLKYECSRLFRWFEISKYNHPGILSLRTAQVKSEQNDRLVVLHVTPFIPGENLETYMKKNTLNQQQKVLIATQIIESANFLHQHNLVHGDIKPSNYMVSVIGGEYINITLVDMDSLTYNQEDIEVDSTAIYNTQGYFQATSYDADIWALGLTLYQLCTYQKIMPDWSYDQYYQRDCELEEFEDGYGVFDEVLRICLYKYSQNRNLAVISKVFSKQLSI